MRIGSVSKQFTALAYLLLCEDGKATPEDRLGKYFAKFKPIAKRVQMMQLLGHTSGLRDASDMRFRLGGLEGRPVAASEVLSLYEEIDDLDAEPGTTWIYNNGAYMILSTVVQMLADRPFGEFLKERIFSPLGMYDTVVRPWDTEFGSNSASPHTRVNEDRFERRYWGIEFGGAGSLSSTVDDLLRWLRHMECPRVGTPKTWTLMLTPQSLLNGASTGYSCGLIRTRYRGVDVICHGGGWIGGNAQALKVPAYGLDVVVLSNRSDVFSPVLVHRILDECLPDLSPLPDSDGSLEGSEGFSLYRVPHSQPAREYEHVQESSAKYLAGSFLSASSGRIVQLFARDGRQIVSVDGHDLPYDRINERQLAPIAIWSHVHRTVELLGDARQPSALRLMDFGETDLFDLLQEAAVFEPRAILGLYRETATRAGAAFYLGQEGPRLNIESRFGSVEYTVRALTALVFRITSASSGFLDAIITFTPTYDAFYLSSYNVKRLWFRRVAETK